MQEDPGHSESWTHLRNRTKYDQAREAGYLHFALVWIADMTWPVAALISSQWWTVTLNCKLKSVRVNSHQCTNMLCFFSSFISLIPYLKYLLDPNFTKEPVCYSSNVPEYETSWKDGKMARRVKSTCYQTWQREFILGPTARMEETIIQVVL